MAPPQLENELRNQRAKLLYILLWLLALCALSITIIISLLGPSSTYQYRLLGAALGLPIVFAAMLLLRTGRVELAGWIIVFLLWLTSTIPMVLVTGFEGGAQVLQVMMVLIAGLAIDYRAAYLLAALCIVLNAGIAWMDITARWWFQSAYLIMAAVSVHLAMRVTLDSLMRTKTEADRFRSLFERTSDTVVFIEATISDTRILAVNENSTKLLGYTVDELVGMYVREILVDKEKAYGLFTSVIEGDIRRFDAFGLKKKNGEHISVDVNMALVYDDDGQPQHAQCLIRDVTEQKEAEEALKKSEARYRGIVEAQTELIMRMTPDGIITFANDAIVDYFNWKKKKVLNQSFSQVFSKGSAISVQENFQRLMKRGPHNKRAGRMASSGGHARRQHWINRSIFDEKGKFDGALHQAGRSLRDLDLNKSALLEERERVDKAGGKIRWQEWVNQALFDSTGELIEMQSVGRDVTDLVKEMADRVSAEKATKAKGEFLANMSHEIRTPMNAITSLTYLTQQTGLTAQQEDYLAKIQSSSQNLLGLINDILDFSKIEAGKLEMEEIDLNLEDVLSDVANVIAAPAQEKGLELVFDTQVDIPRNLIGDPMRLRQVLTNLISNAVKFTEKGEIIVTSRLKNKFAEKAELQFSVEDTGIGITTENVSGLFGAFSQADTTITRQYGGTGLGLAISKQIVEMMDGTIGVTSELGKGCKFTFTIIVKLGKQKEKAKLVPTPDLRGMRVLVVDDNATARKVMRGYLEAMQFKVSSASSGAAAIKKLVSASKKNPLELVIMDWKMPNMNGIEASEKIKNNPSISNTPVIIMVTAYGLDDVMKKAKGAGLEGFLVKPITQSLLFDNIMQAFGKQDMRPAKKTKKAAFDTEELSEIQGARILLVEDNEINQQVAREILESASFVVDIANNGKQAVSAVSRSDYDVVLMDINMPKMSGYEATQKIREQKRFKDLPIIAMTAQALVGDHEKSLEAGMDDHLTKPINPMLLFSSLLKWIRPGERSIPEGKKR